MALDRAHAFRLVLLTGYCVDFFYGLLLLQSLTKFRFRVLFLYSTVQNSDGSGRVEA